MGSKLFIKYCYRWISQHTSLSLLMVGFVICYSLFGTFAFLQWQEQRDSLNTKTYKYLSGLHNSMEETLLFTRENIVALSYDISKTDYTASNILPLLIKRWDKSNGIVRFAWSNDQKQLLVSSTKGIYNPPYDLSARDYIHRAIQQPNQIHISHIINNVVIGTPIIVMAMGITDSEGHYKGAINGSINFVPLTHLIKKQMGNSSSHYLVLAPKGEVIASRGDIEALQQNENSFTFTSDDGFTVIGYSDPAEISRITWQHIVQSLSIMLVITFIIITCYLLITRFILRPVESTVTALEAIFPQSPIPHKLTDQLNQITQLAAQYATMQKQLQISEQKLTQSHQLIEAMGKQQSNMLNATSAQMEQTFQAIARYTEHMEDMIIAKRMDEDQLFHFDDVKEMGDNLQLVSSSFYRVCAINEGSNVLNRQSVDLSEILHHSANLLGGALERRNQSIHINSPDNAESMLYSDASIIAELCYCLLYSAIHFAEDEAQIDINLQHGQDGWKISYNISHYRRSLLPPEKQDFSAFMPSAARDVSEPLKELIMQHMNIWIARSFLALHDSDLVVSTAKDGSFNLSIEITDLESHYPITQDALQVVH